MKNNALAFCLFEVLVSLMLIAFVLFGALYIEYDALADAESAYYISQAADFLASEKAILMFHDDVLQEVLEKDVRLHLPNGLLEKSKQNKWQILWDNKKTMVFCEAPIDLEKTACVE